MARSGWGLCPAHDDNNPSLSIKAAEGGKVLVHCHAGCTQEAVLAKLREQALWPVPAPAITVVGTSETDSWIDMEGLGACISGNAQGIKGKPAGIWPYRSRAGDVQFVVARFDTKKGKTFRPFHHTPDGWQEGDPPGPLPLFGLDKLGADGRVYVVEGEKCAKKALSLGLTAVTSAHGAQSPHKTDWRPLAGREVVILPDNDEPGRKYGRSAAQLLASLNPPARVKVVEMPGLTEGGDIVDYVGAQAGRGDAQIRASIEALVESKPEMQRADLIGGPILTCLADVEPEEVQWLWPGRIARGKLTLIFGDPGKGKSLVTLDMAARVSKGLPWPDGSGLAPRGKVIVVSCEDDLADTIRPRLDAVGADPGQIISLDGVRELDRAGELIDRGFMLQNTEALRQAIRRCSDVKLLVIDPVSAYLAETDSHHNAAVRGLLAPLAKLASDFSVAVVMVTHLNKSVGGSALQRATGSIAFAAAARSAWLIASDPKEADRRMFLPAKNNIGADGSGLAFTITEAHVEWESSPVMVSADDVMAAVIGNHKPGPAPDALNGAVDFLRATLSEGPLPATEVERRADEAGIRKRTLERAKKELSIKSNRRDDAWIWELPTPDWVQDGRKGEPTKDLGDLGGLESLQPQCSAVAPAKSVEPDKDAKIAKLQGTATLETCRTSAEQVGGMPGVNMTGDDDLTGRLLWSVN